jgi:hypothetical protein
MFTADFETTTKEEDCRVWAWAVCEIGNEENIVYGNSIESYIFEHRNKGHLVHYFHNLKFDGEFIIHWLLTNDFEYLKDGRLGPNQFNALISDTGQFYKIKIMFGNRNNTLELRDSLKLLNYKVSEIAKAFDLPIQKLELDYKEEREPGHILTDEEKAYLTNDVKIMALALNKIFDMGYTKLTQGSCALADYKEIVGKKHFEKLFPPPDYDSLIRKSYKGGFTYLNPVYANIDVGEGNVLDVNSLYPSRMYSCELPYGEPLPFKGKYEYDKFYPLYIQTFSCEFDLKENYIPTIQLKGNFRFLPTEYVVSSGNDVITLTLTSVDMELFLEHYNVYNVEYIEGWKFRSSSDFFKSYIDKWMQVKIESGKSGNKTMRNWAKIMLNSLYGKFALNPICAKKHPFLTEDKRISYHTGEKEIRDPIYLPVGSFITAYARYYTITTSQKIKQFSIEKYGKDMYIYSDTDSIHTLLPIDDLKSILEIDDFKLGAWAHESHFTRARFIRAKTYIEEIDGVLNVTCAGMPENVKGKVSWENFKPGSIFEGKLMPCHTNGGIVLKDTTFTIK